MASHISRLGLKQPDAAVARLAKKPAIYEHDARDAVLLFTDWALQLSSSTYLDWVRPNFPEYH